MGIKWAFILLALTFPRSAFCTTFRAIASYLDLPDGATPTSFAADSAGNFFVAFTFREASGRQSAAVAKTDPQGKTLARIDIDAQINGLAVDPGGNVVIVGTTGSTDFTLVSPLISKTSQNSAFLMKIDSPLQNILFSTRLGGTQGKGPTGGGTSGGALTIDGGGNIYVTGSTLDTDFPVTPGAYQTQPPQGDAFGSSVFAYVTEISADGNKILFSTYFGTDQAACLGGSHCIGVHGETSGTAIALDAGGNVVVAGNTDADQLPVTPGVFGPNCDCSSDVGANFLAKFDSSGTKLFWATYFPVVQAVPGPGFTALRAMALDHNGNVIIAGSTVGCPLTSGALQTMFPMLIGGAAPAGFVSKVDSTAHQLLFSTYFGGGDFFGDGVGGLVVDDAGTIWITGSSSPQALPVPHGTPLLGPSYVAGLSTDGSSLTEIFTAPAGAGGQAMLGSAGGRVVALGGNRAILNVNPGSGASLVGVANSAESSVSPAVAPEELVSLYGIDLGPSTPASAQVVNGVVGRVLGGVQVLFDGVAAPLLFVGPNQINAVVPAEVAGSDTTTLTVVSPSGNVAGPTLLVRPTQPGVFRGGPVDPLLAELGETPAAAANQDGSLNSPMNPAPPGSVVSIWATGAGTINAEPDGAIAESVGGDFGAAVFQLYESGPTQADSLEMLYAGDAPGMVRGVAQVNFRLPAQPLLTLEAPRRVLLQLQIGIAESEVFSVYVKQP